MAPAVPAARAKRRSTPTAALPRSTHYLIHPVLFDVIARINPAFLQRIDRVNIVGYDRPWRETASVDRTVNVRQCCVLKADIQSFSTLMRAGADAPVRSALEEAVHRWAPVAAITESARGRRRPDRRRRPGRARADGAPPDGRRLPGARASRACASPSTTARCRRARATPTCAPEIAGGDAILCASRVEPVVEAGQIWATEEFRQQFLERPSLWRTSPLTAPSGDDLFNVKKKGSQEPDAWVRLYRLET